MENKGLIYFLTPQFCGRAKIYYFWVTSARVDVISVNTIIMSVNTI